MAIRDRMSLRAFALGLTTTGAALGVSVVTALAADPTGVWLTSDPEPVIDDPQSNFLPITVLAVPMIPIDLCPRSGPCRPY